MTLAKKFFYHELMHDEGEPRTGASRLPPDNRLAFEENLRQPLLSEALTGNVKKNK